MSIFKAITTIATTPIRCVGQIGKDLSTLNPDNYGANEGDGILSILTLGGSSVVKATVKSLEKAGKELDE